MGIETTYSAVMGGLVQLIWALNANATPKLFTQERYGNRSEKLATLGLHPFSDGKLRSPKSSTPSKPTAPVPTPASRSAHSAANANSEP